MTSYLITGPTEFASKYIEEFLEDHKFKEHEIYKFEEIVRIDDARRIKEKLSYSMLSQKIFIFFSGMTIEAQNALLKSIEESDESTYFIFCSKKYGDYLSTIYSRCQVISPKTFESSEPSLKDLFKGKISLTYSDIDKVSLATGKKINQLLPELRKIVLASETSYEARKAYFTYCKKLMSLTSLADINNVNEKVILESIFLA